MEGGPVFPLLSPYSEIARVYDCTVGFPFFLQLRASFEKLVQRYGIRFQSAADLGCGTGLFACYLNLCWNVPVYAVDYSEAMLHEARRNCRGTNVCFLRQDIRCLALPSPVDLITANFDTLNHVKIANDLRLVFKRIAANLRPGGHFYFDVLTSCQNERTYQVLVPNRCLNTTWLQQRIDWNPRTRLIQTTAIQRRAGGRCIPPIARVIERAYDVNEVGDWLRHAGFIVRGVHDFETLQLPSACPPRIIIIAQKANWDRKVTARSRDFYR